MPAEQIQTTSKTQKTKNRKGKTKKTNRRKPRTKVKDPVAVEVVTRPYSEFFISSLNPRKERSEAVVRELAASIASKGVLQSIVARKTDQGLEAAFGGTRLAAIAQLIGEGKATQSYPVPVQIRNLSDLELLELAVTENDDREDVNPLEDASAYAKMLELGADIASIALSMDKTENNDQVAPRAV